MELSAIVEPTVYVKEKVLHRAWGVGGVKSHDNVSEFRFQHTSTRFESTTGLLHLYFPKSAPNKASVLSHRLSRRTTIMLQIESRPSFDVHPCAPKSLTQESVTGTPFSGIMD
jgi:hypothetical protein